MNYEEKLLNKKRKYNEKIEKIKQEITQGESKVPLTQNFSSIINLQYKKDVCNTNENNGFNDLFEVYNIKNDTSCVYLASKNKQNKNIDIFEIKSIEGKDKKLLTLECSQDLITMIKYFKDPFNDKEYLVAADKKLMAFVWQIIDRKKYHLIKQIDSNYEERRNTIYSCLLFFTCTKKYIMLTKFSFGKSLSRLVDFESGEIFRRMIITKDNKTRYISQWLNKKTNNVYMIECCANDRIIIYEPLSQEIYQDIKLKGDNFSSCIISKKNSENDIDYLCVINNDKNDISVLVGIDLYNKEISFKINLNIYAFQIFPWNDRFLFFCDKNNRAFSIIDMESKNVISSYAGFHGNRQIKCVKKAMLNDKELLFSFGADYCIKLWINESKDKIVINY